MKLFTYPENSAPKENYTVLDFTEKSLLKNRSLCHQRGISLLRSHQGQKRGGQVSLCINQNADHPSSKGRKSQTPSPPGPWRSRYWETDRWRPAGVEMEGSGTFSRCCELAVLMGTTFSLLGDTRSQLQIASNEHHLGYQGTNLLTSELKNMQIQLAEYMAEPYKRPLSQAGDP